VDELEAAQKATEKIHELREQLDRLREFVFAFQKLGGRPLDRSAGADSAKKYPVSVGPSKIDE